MTSISFKLDPNRYAHPAEQQVLEAHTALDAETLGVLEARTAKAATIVRDAGQKPAWRWMPLNLHAPCMLVA